jgi:hypothetical protein
MAEKDKFKFGNIKTIAQNGIGTKIVNVAKKY